MRERACDGGPPSRSTSWRSAVLADGDDARRAAGGPSTTAAAGASDVRPARRGTYPGAPHLEVYRLMEMTEAEIGAELGIEPGAELVAYCHSGSPLGDGSADARGLAGYEARNFGGSWHEWSRHDELPLEPLIPASAQRRETLDTARGRAPARQTASRRARASRSSSGFGSFGPSREPGEQLVATYLRVELHAPRRCRRCGTPAARARARAPTAPAGSSNA